MWRTTVISRRLMFLLIQISKYLLEKEKWKKSGQKL